MLAALLCVAACATKPPPPEPPPAPVLPAPQTEEPEPQIQEPVLTISSIAILQAELINTRFKVRLRIDNPNSFPVELSALSYELYGAGRFWADGSENAVMQIPPEGFAENELFLVMNFMNMKREVLDTIIALKAVQYRFRGEAAISAGTKTQPQFTMGFDLMGESPVER
jgi:LEA14-like dessication related protein